MRNGTAGVPWLPRPQGFRAACQSCQGFSNSRVCAFFSIRVRNVSQNIGSLYSVQSDLGQSSSCYVGASMAILRWPARTKVFQECILHPHHSAIGLLDFQKCVFSSPYLQCSTQEYPTAEHPRRAQAQSIPAVPNRKVFLSCADAESTNAEYPCRVPKKPCSANPRILTPSHRISLQRPTSAFQCCAQPNIRHTPDVPCSAPILQ